jgi:hypothetical protein
MLITPGDEDRQSEGEVVGRKEKLVRGGESDATGLAGVDSAKGAVGEGAIEAELGGERRKSRWGPMLGSTLDVPSGEKNGRQGKIGAEDKPLPLQHKWFVVPRFKAHALGTNI